MWLCATDFSRVTLGWSWCSSWSNFARFLQKMATLNPPRRHPFAQTTNLLTKKDIGLLALREASSLLWSRSPCLESYQWKSELKVDVLWQEMPVPVHQRTMVTTALVCTVYQRTRVATAVACANVLIVKALIKAFIFQHNNNCWVPKSGNKGTLRRQKAWILRINTVGINTPLCPTDLAATVDGSSGTLHRQYTWPED